MRFVRFFVVAAIVASVTVVFARGGERAEAAKSVTSTIALACNNTFNGTKFPLEYRVVSRPSLNPIPPDSEFTVTFDVTVVASAGFLNGVYAAIGTPQKVDILEAKATIVPLSGATGAAVQVAMPSKFTIPAPASTPVTEGVDIPLGSVTGTYTAGSSGNVAFTFDGNPWSPDDTLPGGVTEPAWTGAGGSAALTSSGAKTYSLSSILSGVVKPYLVCGGGAWAVGGTEETPTFGPPLTAETTGFGLIEISDGPQLPDDDATPTTLPSPTTTVGGVATTTTVGGGATTTTVGGGATPTTVGGGATTTTLPAVLVTGSASYTTTCIDSLIESTNILTIAGTASALTPVQSGTSVAVTGQFWTVTLPEELVATLRGLLGATFDAKVSLTLSATNATPSSITSSPQTVTIDLPPSGTATVEYAVPDMTFTPSGDGDVVITLSGSVTEVDLGGTPVTLTCTVDGTPETLLTIETYGQTVPTTTTTAVSTETTTPSGGTQPPAAAGGGGGSGGAGSGSGNYGSGGLGTTGSSLLVTWILVFVAVALLQLGVGMWTVGERTGRRLRWRR
jgi:hypothetical protein